MTEILYYVPGVKERYLGQGLDLLNRGEYQEAIDLSDKLLSVYKRFPAGHYIKAVAQINLGKTEEAPNNIEAFLNSGTGVPRTHHEAGMCYLALGDLEKAEGQFKKVIAIDPRTGRSFVPLTIIEQLRGNHKLALSGLSLTLSQREPPTLIHYLRANIFMADGNKKEYQREMEEAKDLVPGMKLEFVFPIPSGKETVKLAEDRNLMILYYLNGWYDKAVQKGDSITKLASKDFFAWWYKGLSKMAQKNLRKPWPI